MKIVKRTYDGNTTEVIVERCNLTRADMPYEAWLEIAPIMKNLRLKGAFDAWDPGRRSMCKY